MNWELLESDQDLEDMLKDAAGRSFVAVDTEFMRRNTFYPQAALLQLCFDEIAWLIDPLAISDLSPLIELMEDRNIVKILHSASEDLEVFQHWLGVLPQPLFDTQRAAAMVGRGFGMGYRALVQDIEGVDLPKGETRSDWLQRPLTDSQCDYAALDVIHLLPVWKQLDAECLAQGRREWVLDDGADATNSLASAANGYHKKIKTAWKLNGRQLGLLAAVCDWRERTARKKDKPRGWIIDDKACLQLAQINPRNLSDFQGSIDLPPPAIRRYGDELLDLLARESERPDDTMPQPLGKPLEAGERNTLKQLKNTVKQIATAASMTPEILLSGKDYEMLIREARGEKIDPPVSWLGWRNTLVIEPLRLQLSGAVQ
ncbi:MAG: ribonuclease D [Halioglobus sp.]